MENVRRYRDFKFVSTEARWTYLLSEPNYHIAKFLPKGFLALEMKKTQILVNKTCFFRPINIRNK